MYRELASTDALGFGDILEAAWLFDVYLRPDAKALYAQKRGDKVVGYLARAEPPTVEPQSPKDIVAVSADFSPDYALAFGHTRAAIVLTDDCELETLLGRTDDDGTVRKPRGRILMAAVRQASEDEIGRVNAGNTSMYPMPPEEDFLGGIVDLGRTFTVNTANLVSDPDYRRIAGLDRDAKVALSQRWCAYATRHGPIIAAQAALTLARLLSAEGDSGLLASIKDGGHQPAGNYIEAAEAISASLTSAWQLEGPIADAALADWEAGDATGQHRHAVVTSLSSIRLGADAALALLGEPSWLPELAGAVEPTEGATGEASVPKPPEPTS